MKRFSFIIFSVLFLFNNSLTGQTGPECQAIGITEPVNFITTTAQGDVFPGQTFCLEIGVEDFTSVIGFQFTFSFDPTTLQFVDFLPFMGSLTGPLVHNPNLADQGLLPILWTNANSEGQTLPDGMGIANICFEVIGDPGPVEVCVSNNIPGVTPVTEVSYQIDENTTCSDTLLLIDGNVDCSVIDVQCSDLTIFDLGVCNSVAGGTITFSICGGTPPYNYNLNGLAPGTANTTDPIIYNNLPAGTYTIEVTDGAGIVVRETVDIVSLPEISFNSSAVGPTCDFSEDGEIRIFDFVNGTAPYVVTGVHGLTYQNVMPGDTVLIERIANGTYTITVEDAQGCSVMLDIPVLTPELIIDFDIVPPSCVGASDGMITINVSGGVPFSGGQYAFENNLSDSYVTTMPFLENNYNDFTGEFRIDIQDSSGCTRPPFIISDIPVVGTITFNVSDIVDVDCKGDSTGSVVITDVVPGSFSDNFVNILDEFGTPYPSGIRNDSLIIDSSLPAGTYTVDITNIRNGCREEGTFVINEPALGIELTPSSVSPNCGMSDGEATVAAFGGTQPYTYMWADDPTENSNTLSGLDAGTYSVTVIDDLGCSDTLSIVVDPGGLIDIDAMLVTGLGCDNMGTGELAVTLNTSTTPPISFTWFDDMDMSIGMGQMVNVTSPGLYYVEVITSDCTARDTVEILPGGGFTFDIITESPTCPTFNNGRIALENFAGGTAPYECNWSPIPFVGCDNPNLSEGLYMVTISDADGCEVDTMITLTNEIIDITFTIDAVSPACPGEMSGSIEILDITGGQAPYTCEFADPTVTSCNPTDLPAGIYDFVIIDDNGCMSVDTFAEIFPNLNFIDFNASVTNPECGGASLGSIDIVSGPGSSITVAWSDPTLMGNTLTDLDPGDYTATITDMNNCSLDTTFTLIFEDDNFIPEFNINVPDCPNGTDGSISLINCIGCDCNWEEPTLNIQGCDLVSLSPGLYRVTITDALGCQADSTLDLTVPDALEVTVTNIMDAACFQEDSGQATASVTNDPRGVGIYDYIWSNGNTDDAEISATDVELPVGENFVIAFDGTCVDTFFFDIGEPDELLLDLANVTTVMANCFDGCDGTATLAAIGGTSASGDYTFRWEDGVESDSRIDLCAGVNRFTIIDDNGCETLDSITIDNPDPIVIDTVSLIDVNCLVAESGLITINVVGGCNNYSYAWTDGVSDTDTASDLVAGEYTVTVTDGCGCTAESSFTLAPPSMILATPITPEVPNCLGDLVCIGIEPGSVSGGTGTGYTFTIRGGQRVPIDSCVLVPTGTYIIEVNDDVGCPSEAFTVVVDPPNDFSVDLGPDLMLSLGDSTTISAIVTGGTPPFTYNWNSTSPFNCVDMECDMITIQPTNFSNYQVLVTDANGCETFAEINVEVRTERNVYIPDTFRPGADAPNDRFMLLTGQGVEQLNFLQIFDRWGNVMYELENIPAPTNIDMGWDGRRGTGNNEVEAGVYVYVAEVLFSDNATIKYSGSITLIK
jgi:hypothetical protein